MRLFLWGLDSSQVLRKLTDDPKTAPELFNLGLPDLALGVLGQDRLSNDGAMRRMAAEVVVRTVSYTLNCQSKHPAICASAAPRASIFAYLVWVGALEAGRRDLSSGRAAEANIAKQQSSRPPRRARARRAVAAMEETMDSVQSIDPLQLDVSAIPNLPGFTVKTKKKNHGRCHTFSLVNGVRIEQSEGMTFDKPKFVKVPLSLEPKRLGSMGQTTTDADYKDLQVA
eukprot:s4713_g12.t1